MSSTGTPCTNLANMHCTMYGNCEFHMLFTVCMLVFDNYYQKANLTSVHRQTYYLAGSVNGLKILHVNQVQAHAVYTTQHKTMYKV